MNSLKKCYCNKCDKRILNHKPSIKCSLCNNNYHGNCSNMLPSDIKILIFYDRYNSWLCTPCCVDIFPFSSTNEAVDTNHNRSTIRLPPQVISSKESVKGANTIVSINPLDNLGCITIRDVKLPSSLIIASLLSLEANKETLNSELDNCNPTPFNVY